jgi:hypothetical protein
MRRPKKYQVQEILVACQLFFWYVECLNPHRATKVQVILVACQQFFLYVECLNPFYVECPNPFMWSVRILTPCGAPILFMYGARILCLEEL